MRIINCFLLIASANVYWTMCSRTMDKSTSDHISELKHKICIIWANKRDKVTFASIYIEMSRNKCIMTVCTTESYGHLVFVNNTIVTHVILE